jgi:hypothetical protein
LQGKAEKGYGTPIAMLYFVLRRSTATSPVIPNKGGNRGVYPYGSDRQCMGETPTPDEDVPKTWPISLRSNGMSKEVWPARLFI